MCIAHAGLHTDSVFVGGASLRLLTAWVPLGDVDIAHGPPLVRANVDYTLADICLMPRA